MPGALTEYEKAVALAAREANNAMREQNNAQAQEVLDGLDKGLPTY